MPKVALITGAARRVGAEIATTLHHSGFHVALHYNHSETEAKHLFDQLNRARAKSASIFQADLSSSESCTRLIQEVGTFWGQLDILINNASRFDKTLLGSVTDADWDKLMNTNLKAAFFLSQAAKELLAINQGCIINIADVHAERPMRHYSVYCISKAGLIMLTKSLAHELGPQVRVNAISPGIVALPEGDNELSKEVSQKILASLALKRHGTPQDIAKAVLFLAQDGDFITGQTITIDGGRTLVM